MNDFNTFGLLFESMVVRDLKVYAEANNGNVYHYRDKKGIEVDAIIHLENGMWGACEVKLYSEENINEGAKHLLEFKNNLDYTKMKEPSFLMIITVTKFAYKREDGIIVAPLACLKP